MNVMFALYNSLLHYSCCDRVMQVSLSVAVCSYNNLFTFIICFVFRIVLYSLLTCVYYCIYSFYFSIAISNNIPLVFFRET